MNTINTLWLNCTPLVFTSEYDYLTLQVAKFTNAFLQAINGKGMDRHLLGLKRIAAEHGRPIPSILETEAYKKMMAFTLSTSQVCFLKILFGPL